MPASTGSTAELLLADYAVELQQLLTKARQKAGAGPEDSFDIGRHMGLYEAFDLLRQLIRDFDYSLEGVSLGAAGSIEELHPLK